MHLYAFFSVAALKIHLSEEIYAYLEKTGRYNIEPRGGIEIKVRNFDFVTYNGDILQ